MIRSLLAPLEYSKRRPRLSKGLAQPDTLRMAKSHANAAQLRQVLRLFAQFGHPLRVIIYQRVARAPQTAGELAAGLPVSRTAIVQHLKLLESGSSANKARRSLPTTCG
jgi:hypothetical protein